MQQSVKDLLQLCLLSVKGIYFASRSWGLIFTLLHYCYFLYSDDVIKMEEEIQGEFSQVLVSVRFVRRSGFYLLTLYIPSVLLVSISYFSLYFNPIDFNSRINVTLTSLLVLASLYTQVKSCQQKSWTTHDC